MFTMPKALRMPGAAILITGLTLAPVARPDAQPTQVQRGEYLARAGDCISCHTTRGGQPSAAGARLNTPFRLHVGAEHYPGPGNRDWTVVFG